MQWVALNGNEDNTAFRLELQDGRVAHVWQDDRGLWDGLELYESKDHEAAQICSLQLKVMTEMWGYASMDAFLKKVAEMAFTLRDETKVTR